MDQRYWIKNWTGAITLIFSGPQIKSIAGLIKVSSLVTFRKCYDSLKTIFKGKILLDFFANKINHQNPYIECICIYIMFLVRN